MSVHDDTSELDEEFERFLEPWKYDNTLGIPEIPMSELDLTGDHLGSGRKGSVQVAIWKGQRVALKHWTDLDRGPEGQWELVVYSDLKEVQGVLVPKLFFCSRMPNGARVVGLQIGDSLGYEDDLAGSGLQKALSKVGWRQREMSFRRDNAVWLQQEDGTKRIASIDLETFVPSLHRHRESLTERPFRGRGICGIPEISPAEVEIQSRYDPHHQWSAYWRHSQGSWLGKPVSLLIVESRNDFKRLDELKDVQGELIPKPLFVTRERSGRILLGCEPLKEFSELKTSDFDAKQQELVKGLASLGWKKCGFTELAWTTEKRLVVVHMSSLIKLTAEEQASTVAVAQSKVDSLRQDFQELVVSGSSKPTSETESLHCLSDCPDLHECTSTPSSTLPRLQSIPSVSQESASFNDILAVDDRSTDAAATKTAKSGMKQRVDADDKEAYS